MKKREFKLHEKQAEKLRKHAKASSDDDEEEGADSDVDSWSGEKLQTRTVIDKNKEKSSTTVSPKTALLQKKKRDLDIDFLAFDDINE